MQIDINKIEHRIPNVEDAKEHFLAVQDTYKEASVYLPDFVGMEHWTIPQHEKYLISFGSPSPNVKNYLFFYEGKVVGAGHLFPSGWKQSGELIYWVRTGWEGLGVGEHIAKTMARTGGSNFGYKWIVIETDRNNIASRKIAEKSGGILSLIYGYIDHFGKNSNMIVWAIPTFFGTLSGMYSNSPNFDPVNPKLHLTYRYDYSRNINRYLAANPNLLR